MFAILGLTFACGNGGNTSDASTEASAPNDGATDVAMDVADSSLHCTGVGAVCASGPGFACATQFATDDCMGKSCCILAPDGDPPYYDDSGTCPGMCAAPDDIGCPHWYRGCGNGTLCCVVNPPDAATD